MKRARFIRTLDGTWTGYASLYQVTPPMTYHKEWDGPTLETNYVIVSTTWTFGMETFIFPACQGGEALDWCELNGSMKGETSHTKVLWAAGYVLEVNSEDLLKSVSLCGHCGQLSGLDGRGGCAACGAPKAGWEHLDDGSFR